MARLKQYSRTLLGLVLTAMTAGHPVSAATNLTELMDAPGVVNPLKPPNPDFPFDQSVPYRVSSDGSTVVYIKDEAFFSLQIGSQDEPTPLAEGIIGDIIGFELSADGLWLVYVAERTRVLPPETTQRMYTVPVDGSAVVSTVGPAAEVVDGAGGIDFQITFNSQRIVFTASARENDPLIPDLQFASFNLYKANIGGGDAIQVNPEAANALRFEVSDDSSRVVYAQTRELGITQPPEFDLFSEALGSSLSTKLNADDEMVIPFFDITPNSARVVYSAIQESDGVSAALVSEPIGGGGSTSLFEYQNGVVNLVFQTTPNSQRVVFSTLGMPGESKLRSVRVGGGDLDDLSSGISPNAIFFRLSEDSERILFTAIGGSEDDIRSALYVSPTSSLNAAAPDRIAGSLDNEAGALFFPGFQFTRDSQRILYGSIRPDDQLDDKPGATELWSVDTELISPQQRLSPPALSSLARIPFFLSSPDSTRVFFIADDPTEDEFQLYSTLLEEIELERLNGDLPANGDVAFALWAETTGNLVYQADEATDGIYDLWLHEFAIFESGFE